jgi:hypothetical protein
MWTGMKDQKRPKPTTPEEEGIELHPDAWKRFEKTVDKVVKGSPGSSNGKANWRRSAAAEAARPRRR